MTPAGRAIEILLVEDDAGDELITREALKHNKFKNKLHVAHDGEEGLNFLYRFPLVGSLLSQRLIYLVFGFFFIMLVFSNLIIGYSTLFKSRETTWLLSLPQSEQLSAATLIFSAKEACILEPVPSRGLRLPSELQRWDSQKLRRPLI